MSWKPISEQLVIANLDGKVRQVLVTAWNPFTSAVKVAWPPETQGADSRRRFSLVGRTEIAEARYEPLDPDGFKAATKGSMTR
jgi:hypothetical protein